MRELSGHIKSFIIALACILGMGSCIYDYDAYGTVEETEDPDKALFVLHIMPVNTRGDLPGRVVEKIKSLRVIAISKDEEGEDDVIEINRLVTFGDDVVSDNFGYSFTWQTTPGKKDFYIIANEESVPSISFENTTDLPDGVKELDRLTDLLDHYKATPNDEFKLTPSSSELTTDKNTSDSETKSNAAEFKQAINAVCFSPTYEIQEVSGDEKKQIFLPYTTCYEGVEVEAFKNNDFKANSKTMYLVPVATKFYFRFYNYHQNPVEIKNLSIKSIASQNFLLANVDEDDQTKVFDGVDEYWVDWLAKVAEKTRDKQLDNEEVNAQYGWISKYKMPQSNQHNEAVLISEEKNNAKTILVSTDNDEHPLYLGPFYLLESRNEQKGDDDEQIQQYTLGLHLHDTEVNSSTSGDFDEDLVIGNVKALFRATCVLIQITMRRGDVEIYAEIKDWKHNEVDGWAEGGSIMK